MTDASRENTDASKPNPFERDFEDQSLRSLYRKMKKTALARFECATRMRRHQKYSLWTISIFSTGLILFPLIQAFGIPVHVSTAWFNIMQVALALMVLVLSLLISANNVGDKAEKMHRCALELNALCHEALPFCRDGTNEEGTYERFRVRYAEILNVYENHDTIDFDIVRLKMRDEYELNAFQRLLIQLRWWLDFWVYGLLLLALAVALWVTLLRGATTKPGATVPAVTKSSSP
jgi:hypothetical protein